MPRVESQCLCGVNAALCADGSLFTPIMIQLYASTLMHIINDLRSLESAAKTWTIENPADDEMSRQVNELLVATVTNCAWLRLRSAWKQLHTIQKRVKSGTCRNDEFAQLISELRRRIFEDLDDRVFYCVTETSKLDRFFKHNDKGYLVAKQADEAFEPRVVNRFPECLDDLIGASKCYIAACYTACVFHLMRVVERGLAEVASLAGITDPKASWGAVLSKIDLYAFRTKHQDLPDGVKPHHDLLRDLSAEMHAIQHAWRNRVSHIENKLIPDKPIEDPQIASEVMTAVEAFMRSLADRLPAKSI